MVLVRLRGRGDTDTGLDALGGKQRLEARQVRRGAAGRPGVIEMEHGQRVIAARAAYAMAQQAEGTIGVFQAMAASAERRSRSKSPTRH